MGQSASRCRAEAGKKMDPLHNTDCDTPVFPRRRTVITECGVAESELEPVNFAEAGYEGPAPTILIMSTRKISNKFVYV